MTTSCAVLATVFSRLLQTASRAHCVLAAIISVLCVANANAVPLTWTLNNATFTDGGMATGSYMFDADTAAFSNISITTSGGVLPATSYQFVLSGSNLGR